MEITILSLFVHPFIQKKKKNVFVNNAIKRLKNP